MRHLRGGGVLLSLRSVSILTPGNTSMFSARLVPPEHICMDRQFQRIVPVSSKQGPPPPPPPPSPPLLPSSPLSLTLQRRQARRSRRDIRVTTYDRVAQRRVTSCECVLSPAFSPQKTTLRISAIPQCLLPEYQLANQPRGRSRKPLLIAGVDCEKKKNRDA